LLLRTFLLLVRLRDDLLEALRTDRPREGAALEKLRLALAEGRRPASDALAAIAAGSTANIKKLTRTNIIFRSMKHLQPGEELTPAPKIYSGKLPTNANLSALTSTHRCTEECAAGG